MVLLLQNPDVMCRVREDRDLLVNLVEESMRIESPVPLLSRVAAEDTSIGGVEIPKGSLVHLMWGSANRDERKFPEPTKFDLDRPRLVKDQMGFGRGRHRCAGAPLARLEIRLALDRLLTRLADIELDEADSELVQLDTFVLHSWKKVFLKFKLAES
jgi:cytochrome P450